MIPLEAPALFALSLLLFLAPVLVFWVSSEMAHSRQELRARKMTWQCRLCGHLQEKQKKSPWQCPACGAWNEPEPLNFF